jgi:hypothetical protein
MPADATHELQSPERTQFFTAIFVQLDKVEIVVSIGWTDYETEAESLLFWGKRDLP